MQTTRVVTGTVRLSYVKLFKAEPGPDGGEPKFSVQLLIPKTDNATCSALRAAINQAIADKWGAKPPKGLRDPLRDGDTDATHSQRAECRGHWVLNVSAKQDRRPGIVDADRNEILDPSQLYSGCYARAEINAFAYDSKGNKGTSFGINNVQKARKEGERLDGRKDAKDVFTDWDDEEETENAY